MSPASGALSAPAHIAQRCEAAKGGGHSQQQRLMRRDV